MNAAQPIRFPSSPTKLVDPLCGPPRPGETEADFGARMLKFEEPDHEPREILNYTDSKRAQTELAEQRRRVVLKLIGDGEAFAKDLADRLGVEENTMRGDLRKMRDDGLITSRKVTPPWGGRIVQGWRRTRKGKA